MVKERNVVVCILLTIITCGIYGIIWFVSLTDDARNVSGDTRLSGGKALLFTLITCGIYSFVWAYQMGKALSQARVRTGRPANDNSVLYLVLTIFGLGIVNYCLMQSELNEYATTNMVGAKKEFIFFFCYIMLKKIILIVVLLMLILSYLLLGSYFNIYIDCPLYKILNIYCPGCGITRMFKSLIALDFYQAFRYNMFVFLILPILLIYVYLEIRYYVIGKENIFNSKKYKYFWLFLLLAALLFGILRNTNLFSFMAPTKI